MVVVLPNIDFPAMKICSNYVLNTTLGHNWPIKSKNKRKINFGNQCFKKYIHPEWWDGPAVLFNWMFFPFLAHGVFYWKVEEKNQNDIALIQSSPHTQKSSSDNKD